MLREDEHAATGAGLRGGMLGQPAVVGQDGLGRQRRRAVGFAGVLAGDRHRLPGRHRVGQGGLEVAAEGVLAARLLDDRLAALHQPGVLLGQPGGKVEEDHALLVVRQQKAHLAQQDEEELALHDRRQLGCDAVALLDADVGRASLAAEGLGLLLDHLRGDRVDDAQPFDELLFLLPGERSPDEGVGHALEQPVGRAGLAAVGAAGQAERSLGVGDQPAPDPPTRRLEPLHAVKLVGDGQIGAASVAAGDQEVAQGDARVGGWALAPGDDPARLAGDDRGRVAVQVGRVSEDWQLTVADIVLLAVELAELAAAERAGHHPRAPQRVAGVRHAVLAARPTPAVRAEDAVEVPERRILTSFERLTMRRPTAEQPVAADGALAHAWPEGPGRARVAIGLGDALRLPGLLFARLLALLELIPLAAILLMQPLVEPGPPAQALLIRGVHLIRVSRRNGQGRPVAGDRDVPAAAQTELGEGDKADARGVRIGISASVERADLCRRLENRAVPVRQQVAPLGDPLRQRRAPHALQGLLVSAYLCQFADQVIGCDDQHGERAPLVGRQQLADDLGRACRARALASAHIRTQPHHGAALAGMRIRLAERGGNRGNDVALHRDEAGGVAGQRPPTGRDDAIKDGRHIRRQLHVVDRRRTLGHGVEQALRRIGQIHQHRDPGVAGVAGDRRLLGVERDDDWLTQLHAVGVDHRRAVATHPLFLPGLGRPACAALDPGLPTGDRDDHVVDVALGHAQRRRDLAQREDRSDAPPIPPRRLKPGLVAA